MRRCCAWPGPLRFVLPKYHANAMSPGMQTVLARLMQACASSSASSDTRSSALRHVLLLQLKHLARHLVTCLHHSRFTCLRASSLPRAQRRTRQQRKAITEAMVLLGQEPARPALLEGMHPRRTAAADDL